MATLKASDWIGGAVGWALIGFIGLGLYRTATADVPAATPEPPPHPCHVAFEARQALPLRARDASVAEARRLAQRVEALDRECEEAAR